MEQIKWIMAELESIDKALEEKEIGELQSEATGFEQDNQNGDSNLEREQ